MFTQIIISLAVCIGYHLGEAIFYAIAYGIRKKQEAKNNVK